jgi:macrophage erythroblast attacher
VLPWPGGCEEAVLTPRQSNLEYELRLQQYIELVRVGQKIEAIAYYRKYMANSAIPVEELRKAAALLAYQPDTPYEPYKVNLLPTIPKEHLIN